MSSPLKHNFNSSQNKNFLELLALFIQQINTAQHIFYIWKIIQLNLIKQLEALLVKLEPGREHQETCLPKMFDKETTS